MKSTQNGCEYYECISTPICIEQSNQILTLSPSARLGADNMGYNSKVKWVAEYNDGSIITEKDDGQHKSSELIDHKKIRKFKLISDNNTIASLSIKKGQYFFYRRRTAMVTGNNMIEVIHLFGWRSSTDKSDANYMENLCMLFESDMHIEVGHFESQGMKYGYEPQWRDIDNIMTE